MSKKSKFIVVRCLALLLTIFPFLGLTTNPKPNTPKKPKIANYKAFKNYLPTKYPSFRMNYDSLSCKYYGYRYYGIRIWVRIFNNESDAEKAFNGIYLLSTSRSFFGEHIEQKYFWVFPKSGAYHIYNGRTIYTIIKECSHPESFYQKYEKMFEHELYADSPPKSSTINIGCGGRNLNWVWEH